MSAEFARENGLDGQVLPLWHEGEPDPLGAVDPSAALGAGLHLRPVGDTARDVLAAADTTPLVDGAGLPREREAQLLEAARSAGAVVESSSVDGGAGGRGADH